MKQLKLILLTIKESYFIVSKNNIGTMFLLLAIVILASICFFEIINMFVPLKKNEDPKNKLVSFDFNSGGYICVKHFNPLIHHNQNESYLKAIRLIFLAPFFTAELLRA